MEPLLLVLWICSGRVRGPSRSSSPAGPGPAATDSGRSWVGQAAFREPPPQPDLARAGGGRRVNPRRGRSCGGSSLSALSPNTRRAYSGPRRLARRPGARGRDPRRLPRRAPRPGASPGKRLDGGGRGVLPGPPRRGAEPGRGTHRPGPRPPLGRRRRRGRRRRGAGHRPPEQDEPGGRDDGS